MLFNAVEAECTRQTDPRAMKVVVAPDKFRGSLSAESAARAMARGVRAADPIARIDEVPMADGGEGTVDALGASTGGTRLEAEGTGPLGAPVKAALGRLGGGRAPALGAAAAAGLPLV